MPYVIAIDVADITNKCFVAYPFAIAKGVEHPITQVIQDALQKARLGVFWINRETLAKDIMTTVRQNITQAPMLIAICSPVTDGKPNPNVMYELGLADALGKPTLVMTTDPTVLPFDVRSRGAFVYQERDLETEPGRKALVDSLAIGLQELQARRGKAWAILDDIPGTHALEATNGIVLVSPFWIYAQHVLSYAIEVCNAVEGEMHWLARLSDDARSLLRGARGPLGSFFQDWDFYRQYFANHTRPILADVKLTGIKGLLENLTAAAGGTEPTVVQCSSEFGDLKEKIAIHRDMYVPAEKCVAGVQNGTERCQMLFGAVDPLKATAQNLTNTANAVIRKMTERICAAFVR